MRTEREVLEQAAAFLRDEVGPAAQAIDASPDALGRALNGLASRELLALRRPEEFGGPALSERAFREFQEEVARRSGALAFLQTQHQSAGSLIAKCPNRALQERTLPAMCDGSLLLGIGFSQLRRAGPPLLRAEPIEGGYRLDGDVPWITGFGFFSAFVVGAALPDGQNVFGVVPFNPQEREGSSLRFSEPMRLAAMESAMTVSGTLRSWSLPDEDVLFLKPAEWIRQNDQINITLQGHFALGCARAGLDLLLAAAERRADPALRAVYDALDAELCACREAAATAPVGPETTRERLETRAWAIELAVRCAHAAVTATGGSANSLAHPAQRVYREALVFTVSAQTPDVQRATLERLASRRVL